MENITREKFRSYVKVQNSAKYNMVLDAHRAMVDAGLSKDDYATIIKNYGTLADKFQIDMSSFKHIDNCPGDALTVRPLYDFDAEEIVKMDNLTGGDVWCFAQDSRLEFPSDYTWGMFDEKDGMVGYLSLGCADVLKDNGIDITSIDARLLSDVYIKKEYRDNGLGTKMVHDTLVRIDEDVYLTYLYDELQDFYKPLGFRHVVDSDNVMIREKSKVHRYKVTFLNGHTGKYNRYEVEALSEDDAAKLVFAMFGKNFEHRLISVKSI